MTGGMINADVYGVVNEREGSSLVVLENIITQQGVDIRCHLLQSEAAEQSPATGTKHQFKVRVNVRWLLFDNPRRSKISTI
jgi:hypothetical protein